MLVLYTLCLWVTFSITSSLAQSSTQSFSPYQQAKADANKHTVTVVGGGISGTYIRFATDMANVLNDKKQQGLRVLPMIGLGGGQNIKDILFLRGIDMGIAQSEHLAYLKRTNPTLFRNIEDRVRYITKLYESEWHVVARKEIKSIEDLRGKTVNLWKPVSATGIGGRTIFETLGINVKAIYIDTQLALEKVKSGEIAATTLLAGAPIGKYASISESDNLHLVPVSFPKLFETFLPSKLSHKDYPTLIPEGQTIPTVASSAVLAVYNWPKDTQRYRKLETFVNKFFRNIKKFHVKPRHPKWKSTNLAAKVPGWKRFAPAANFLKQDSGGSNKQTTFKSFQSFLKQNSQNKDFSKLSDAEKRAFYKNFLKWMKQNQ